MNADDSRDDQAFDVLLVEDNPGDVRLTREAFAALDRDVTLTVANDGAEALAHLRERVERADAPPSLVILDLDLPVTDGRTVLRELKEDPELMRIPVVVFSGSEDSDDIGRTYGSHANAFVAKPEDASGYFDAIERLSAFWFSTVTLPSSDDT